MKIDIDLTFLLLLPTELFQIICAFHHYQCKRCKKLYRNHNIVVDFYLCCECHAFAENCFDPEDHSDGFCRVCYSCFNDIDPYGIFVTDVDPYDNFV